MHYLTDTSHPETRVMGGPSRVQAAEVVAVNTDDGTIDASLLNGRATKVHVAYPTWWVPQVGERCLLADRDGDARQPVCLGFLSPADGSNAGPQLQGTVTQAKASDTALGVTKLSTAPADVANPIAVGDNDTRVPTQAENDALQGTSGAPSNTNRYVTDADTRIPTAGEAAALLGTSGTPGSGNKYVTDADARNTNARAPSGAASGDLAGTYPAPTVAQLSAIETGFGTGGRLRSSVGNIAEVNSNYNGGTDREINNTLPSWRCVFGLGDLFSIYRAPATNANIAPTFAELLRVSTSSAALDLASNGQKLLFGSTGDTDLFRQAVGVLKTSTQFQTGTELVANVANTANLVVIGDKAAGVASAGMSFGASQDTNLYRAVADTLKTDDTFVALDLFARGSTASQVLVGDMAGKAAIQFGSAVDVNLYRAAAGCLRTDSMLSVAGSSPPAAGQSLEAGCATGVAFFQAFDRTAGSAIKLHLQGSEVSFYDAAAHCRLMIDANGVGFFAVTPVARAAAYTQTYATASRTHSNPTATAVATTAATSTTPFGYTTAAQANAIVTAVNALITDVANVKQVLNSVVDDHQAYGLLQ